jgi:DNA-directed RNA polymerase specialized sigma24 family protein
VLKGVGLSGGEPHPAADFELFYERFRLPLYRFVRGMVLDAEAAEELTRRAFDRAYSARGRCAEHLSPAVWLYGFGVRVSTSHLRRRRLVRLLSGRHPAPGDRDETVARSGVELALGALTPSLRAVALLGLYAHLSSEEIGSILGISEEAAGSRLDTATQVMTAALAGGRPAQPTGPR